MLIPKKKRFLGRFAISKKQPCLFILFLLKGSHCSTSKDRLFPFRFLCTFFQIVVLRLLNE